MQKQRHKFPRQKCLHTNHHTVSMFTTKANITSYVHHNNCTCCLKRRAITVERVTGRIHRTEAMFRCSAACLDRWVSGTLMSAWSSCESANTITYACLFNITIWHSMRKHCLSNWVTVWVTAWRTALAGYTAASRLQAHCATDGKKSATVSLILRADWSDKLEWYCRMVHCFQKKSGATKERTQTSTAMGISCQWN